MKVLVFGHRRSGNHFLMASLEQNFIIEEAVKSHEFFRPKLLETADNPKLLIVRDGRDTLTACYHWWKSARGSLAAMNNKSFSQYLRGEIPHIPKFEQSIFVSEPIDMWISYIKSWIGKIPAVRFEDLKGNPTSVLERIENELGLCRKIPELQLVTQLVGYSPRKGIVGDWKNHFNKEDEEIFWSKAGDIMYKLGYVK
jgi:hypothetical protein